MAYKFPEMKNITPAGPVCRKRIYYTAEEARDTIEHLKETRYVGEIHFYQCPDCGFWHLTSHRLK